MRLEITVRLKKGVQDPEGEHTAKALRTLGFKDVKSARTAKVYVVEVGAGGREEALKQGEEMCKKLLANPVIQEYAIRVEE
ncbi:MAG: phosphoribosylformylglycinamidine synthase subunit PurS [Halobacteria archaeon]